ncbi:MAG: uroporphyrinogen-III synthase [Sphingomonadales bacterium]|nr:MAG: uroporphyrinogen-III synthase [Sphingomonadales bacterium]
MRIWVTRTAPENAGTAASLEDLGHTALNAPVLEVRALECDPLRDTPDAIVFTSSNGVRHHPACSSLFHIPVFAVGIRTAEAALAAGYVDVRSADGDIVDLQRKVLAELPPPARLVHFGAREVAGNLKGFLRRFGYLVERRAVYAAQPVAIRWLLDIRTELPSIHGILVHSPRAAERVARVLAGTGWCGRVWCISEACALKLSGVAGIEIHFASRPTEAAVMEMVRQNGVVRMPARASMRVVAAGAGRPVHLAPDVPANDNGTPSDWDAGGPGDEPPPAA